MIGKCLLVIFMMVCLVIFAGALAMASETKEAPRMAKEQLKEMLVNPNVVIVDVRIGKDWKASDLKIKGAVRKEPKMAKEWAANLDKDKTYVLYCA